jgi:hypothetical protein
MHAGIRPAGQAAFLPSSIAVTSRRARRPVRLRRAAHVADAWRFVRSKGAPPCTLAARVRVAVAVAAPPGEAAPSLAFPRRRAGAGATATAPGPSGCGDLGWRRPATDIFLFVRPLPVRAVPVADRERPRGSVHPSLFRILISVRSGSIRCSRAAGGCRAAGIDAWYGTGRRDCMRGRRARVRAWLVSSCCDFILLICLLWSGAVVAVKETTTHMAGATWILHYTSGCCHTRTSRTCSKTQAVDPRSAKKGGAVVTVPYCHRVCLVRY